MMVVKKRKRGRRFQAEANWRAMGKAYVQKWTSFDCYDHDAGRETNRLTSNSK